MNIVDLAGKVLFTSALTILRNVVIEAVAKRANLSGANLSGADLSGANLSGANLSGADLSRADLSGANLSGANLSGADLSRADLSGADLSGANLSGANLSRADLSRANLSGADLSRADLSGANLSRANLSGADLSRADLSGADLSRANLSGAENATLALAMTQVIPEEGSFVGWKKCRDGVVAKLWIGKTAKRSHGAERKCRASRVKVAEVIGADIGVSMHDSSVTYSKGQVVEPLNGWEENRWEVCAPGIHFFITRAEAEAYTG